VKAHQTEAYQPAFELPRFDTPSELREHRKQRLAATFRILSAFGLDDGTNGHASARDPERTDWFWTNPPGMHFAHVRVSDLLLVDSDGTTHEGPCDVDRVQRNIHAAVLAARSDVVSVVHAHGIYGRAWSTQLRPLDPITQDSCAFYGDQSVMEQYSGVVADPEEGKRIADALGTAKVVVLANHGVLTVGPTVDEATWWFVNYERMCQVQLIAESGAKSPRLIPTEMAAATAVVLGSSTTACFQFKPLYDWIVRREPDLLT
jgi:ribulose-5-phosphate 4-epimerase/fuculose-1-phosphate aldolase